MTISRIFFPVLPSRNPVTVLVFLANCRVKFLLPRVYCASPLTSMGICNARRQSFCGAHAVFPRLESRDEYC